MSYERDKGNQAADVILSSAKNGSQFIRREKKSTWNPEASTSTSRLQRSIHDSAEDDRVVIDLGSRSDVEVDPPTTGMDIYNDLAAFKIDYQLLLSVSSPSFILVPKYLYSTDSDDSYFDI